MFLKNSQTKYFPFSKNASCKQEWLCAKITAAQLENVQGRVRVCGTKVLR